VKKSRPDGELERAVDRRRARDEKWQREGERPLARNLALVGTLGWLIVVPALLGTLAGRAIDRLAATGIAFTAALLLLGVVVGCWLAWSHVRRS
jgi:ATP synthase protein I